MTSFRELAEWHLLASDVCRGYAYQLRSRAKSLDAYLAEIGVDGVEKITEDIFNGWLLKISKGKKQPTISSYRRCCLTLWNVASDRDLVAYPRTRRIRVPKSQLPPPEAFTRKEIGDLILAAMSLEGAYTFADGVQVSRGTYWASLIAAAYDTGLRRGDLLALPLTDAFADRFVVRERKTGKTVLKCLSELAQDILIKAGMDRPLAWPWTQSMNYFDAEWGRILKAAGITRGHFKWLRRSHGSMMGGLNHSSPAVFQRYYEDLRLRQKPPLPPEVE